MTVTGWATGTNWAHSHWFKDNEPICPIRISKNEFLGLEWFGEEALERRPRCLTCLSKLTPKGAVEELTK